MPFVPNPYAGRESYHCFGCAPNNPIGLHLQFEEIGETLIAYWEPSHDYEGWQNILHGGIQASMLDEIGSWFIMVKIKSTGVTSRLDLKYRKAVSLNTGPVKLVASLHEKNSRIVTVKVELFNSSGELCTEGLASFYLIPEDKLGY